MGYAASGDTAYLFKLVEVASLIGDVIDSSKEGFSWEPPEADPRAGKSLEIPPIPSGSSFLVFTQRSKTSAFVAQVTQLDEQQSSSSPPLHPLLDAMYSSSILALRSLLVWGTSRSRPEILPTLVEYHASLGRRVASGSAQPLSLAPQSVTNFALTEVEASRLDAALLSRQVLFLERFLLPNMYRRSSINS
jgi:hypothetical protein